MSGSNQHRVLTLPVRFICPKKKVNNATIMKFTPPAKSVNLSNWKMAAIRKKISWITRIVIPEMAKWSVSNMWTAILVLLACSTSLFYSRKLISSDFSAASASQLNFHFSLFIFTRFHGSFVWLAARTDREMFIEGEKSCYVKSESTMFVNFAQKNFFLTARLHHDCV